MKSFEIIQKEPPSPGPMLPSLEDGYESYRKVEPELLALPDSDVVRVAVDIPRACAIALGANKAIESMKPFVTAKLPAHDVAAINGLVDYIFAAYYANAICAASSADVTRLQKKSEEATPLRFDMLLQAEALAHKGYLDPAKVAEIRAGTGYLDLANDLTTLSLLFRSNWSQVKDKTTVTQQEVERADVLGREILTDMGARLQPNGESTTLDEQLDRRARAFTVFQRAYERCRQAAAYVRWDEGDAEDLVPSLFLRPARTRKPAAGAALAEEPTVASPVAPTPAPAPLNGSEGAAAKP